MSEGPLYFGKYPGTVMNNVDPANRGKILVQVSDIYGPFPTTWALPCFPFAGLMMSGIVALPPINSSVWVEFIGGDPDHPVWTGCFYDETQMFPALALAGASPANPNIHFQTTTGTIVTLSDNPAQQVFVTTATGASIIIGAAGITIMNGQGASIAMVGPTVNINNGALVVT